MKKSGYGKPLLVTCKADIPFMCYMQLLLDTQEIPKTAIKF